MAIPQAVADLSVLSRIVFDPDITPPTVPTGVAALALGQTTIRVSWNASTDSGGSGLAGYVVYRSTTSGGTYSPISSGLSVASLVFDDTTLSAGQQRFYKVLALDGNGNQSALSSAASATTQTITNQPPAWSSNFLTQANGIGDAINLNLDNGCTDPEAQPLTYITTASELAALGLAASGARGNLITGTLTAFGSFGVIADDSVGNPEAEWIARKASVGSGLLEQEDFASYSNRGAWMAHNLAVRDTLNKVIVVYPFTGASSNDSRAYDDPVPAGTQEKVGFDTTRFLTGGKAAWLRFRAGESASDNGPTFGIPIANPTSRMYFQMDCMFDVFGHSYGGSHRKILFLNPHDFEGGQIVGVLYLDREPWPTAYRVTSTTRILARFHPNPPSGFGTDERQVYGAWDTNPGAAYPTTTTAFKQRFGPSRDFPSATDSDYAAIPRLIAGQWFTLTYYIDQDWIGTTSRGMYKLWIQAQNQAPQLIGFNFQDCAFDSFAQTPCRSIRPVFRPENATSFPAGVDHGIVVDKILVSSTPPAAYGFSLPFPGQQIPTGMPITGTTDE